MTPLHLRLARSAVSYLPSPSLLGLRSLPDRIRPGRPHEDDFRWFECWPTSGPVVVDVGANRGQSIRSFGLYLDAPQIHAVEPNPLLAAHLERSGTVGAGSVTNAALSDSEGTLVLYVPRYGHTHYDTRASASTEQAAAFLSSDSFAGFRESRSGVERIEVPMRTLDSLELVPDIVKIDVEGAELGVLQGGQETITSTLPLLLIEEPGDAARELLSDWDYLGFEYAEGGLRPASGSSLNTFFLAERHRDTLL